MTYSVLLLFGVAFFTGVVALYLPRVGGTKYYLGLVFGGSYLFSITIIHLLPELFHQASGYRWVSICVLSGFFLQHGLEFFSSGVEHGHIHVHKKGERHSERSAWMVLVALFVHAFLEGAFIAAPYHDHHQHQTLLTGILLHKAPEAFALMSVLLCELKSKARALWLLAMFSLASPAGLLLSDFLLAYGYLSTTVYLAIVALVCGSFLHISTTVVFESSVNHQFNARKMIVALLGALLAIGSVLFY